MAKQLSRLHPSGPLLALRRLLLVKECWSPPPPLSRRPHFLARCGGRSSPPPQPRALHCICLLAPPPQPLEAGPPPAGPKGSFLRTDATGLAALPLPGLPLQLLGLWPGSGTGGGGFVGAAHGELPCGYEWLSASPPPPPQLYPHEAMNYTAENVCRWALENRELFLRWLRPHGGKSLLLHQELKKGPALFLFLPFDPLAESQPRVQEVSGAWGAAQSRERPLPPSPPPQTRGGSAILTPECGSRVSRPARVCVCSPLPVGAARDPAPLRPCSEEAQSSPLFRGGGRRSLCNLFTAGRSSRCVLGGPLGPSSCQEVLLPGSHVA